MTSIDNEKLGWKTQEYQELVLAERDRALAKLIAHRDMARLDASKASYGRPHALIFERE